MAQPNRTFRLFVSSTFSDLKEERNALHRTVFPALQELCAGHGYRFQAVDLRWGVREEAGLDQQTMRICLDEVKRCCEGVTPKPNFLILLGDKYGWRPLPTEIPADQWEQIANRLRSQGSAGTERLVRLSCWYQLDLNGRPNANPPGIWLLKPRTREPEADYTDFAVWEREVERPLREVFAGVGLTGEDHLKYWASATEQEIHRGALRVDDAPEHVFCFFRRLNGLPGDATAEGFRDLLPVELEAPPAEPRRLIPDVEAEGLLGDLKAKLRAKLPARNFIEREANWIPEPQHRRVPPGAEPPPPISIDHLESLCREVQEKLTAVIRAQIERLEREDAARRATQLDREIEQHEEFRRGRTAFFVGREPARGRIAEYLKGTDPRPLALIGEPGSGKSAVLAKAIAEAREAHPEVTIIFRFIGATPGSAVIRELLDGVCRQLGGEAPVPSEYRELVQEFPKRLKQAGEGKRVLVFLDAVDQLSDADNARNLIWLPMQLEPGVRLVVSTSTEPGDTKAVLERRLPEAREQGSGGWFSLDDMPVEEAHDLLCQWFDDPNAARTLTGRTADWRASTGQWRYLLDRFGGCRRPLYLKLAFEEARRWRSFDDSQQTQLAPADTRLPASAWIPSLIEQLFEKRLSAPANHGETIVSRSLGYLVGGKNGLTEDEIMAVLSRDPDVLREIKRFHRPPEEKLPPVIWSRLYFDLAPYLTERRADGTTLLAFYHRQLDQVAREKYLTPERHRKLAEFFRGDDQPLFRGEGEAKQPNLRRLAELPFQQTYAGDMWNELYSTLTDFDFLEAKCTYVAVTSEGTGPNVRHVYHGVYELQEDYRRALEVFPAD